MSGLRVTIALTVYNGAAYLRPAVESILAQTLADFELVIVDDGSTDDTRQIIAGFAKADSRVVAIYGDHGGISVATNRALAVANGEYFAPMDQDDVALPERLAREVAFLDQNAEVAVVGTGARVIDGEGHELKTMVPVLGTDEVADAMHARCAVLHPSSMMRTEAVRAVGGYRAFLPYAQDYDLFMRIMERGKLANIPDILLQKRTHRRQVTSSVSKRPAQIVIGAIVYMSHMSRVATGSDIFRPNERLTDSAARFIDGYLAENSRLDSRVLHHFSRFLRYAPLAAPPPRRIERPYLTYLGTAVRQGGVREGLRTAWYIASYFLDARRRHSEILSTSVFVL